MRISAGINGASGTLPCIRYAAVSGCSKSRSEMIQ
ncbi:Protein of unknown function [Thermobacillus xylanilyticus]|uniref:Uncharacterized protein n=1 Tax=Thermobacillus xylanilyticus TaxID=76633 RepID=A0ABN7RXJ5_THEXY|nr:Protein of unknown function [Thermobacillus xylanilyticus]